MQWKVLLKACVTPKAPRVGRSKRMATDVLGPAPRPSKPPTLTRLARFQAWSSNTLPGSFLES